MPPTPPITDAEELIMRELWKQSPLTAQDVADRLAPRTAWKLTTVKTLLTRLCAKGAITATPRGKANDYAPTFSEDAWVRRESRSFLDRVYSGALTPMIAHLFQDRRISRDDLNALRELLDQAQNDADQKARPPAQQQAPSPPKPRPRKEPRP